MAMQRRLTVSQNQVFPAGAFLVGEVEAVTDYNAPQRADGTRPQQHCKETGLLLWSVQVLDADPEAGKRDKTVTVKIAAPVQPVPPTNSTPFPFTPVEFVGLTALPWVDDSGQRPRLSWSFRADGFAATATPAAAASGKGGE